jgi:signal transduction histidine kinase
VAALCGVLLLCLLGSVLVLTRYFYTEAADEMRLQAERMAETISLSFEQNPSQDLQQFAESIKPALGGDEVEYRPFYGDPGQALSLPPDDVAARGAVFVERDAQGRLTRVAHMIIPLAGQPTLLTLRVPIDPQLEIVRAFTNRYMLALTGVFVLTCGAMVYLIRKNLRPLVELSESCAAIAGGRLAPVTTRGAAGEVRALEETFNGMVRALHEKELVEAKLRQAQRLSALGNLAAGVAHDVRNPLNAIKLLSSHALDTMGDSPAAKPLQTIRREVDRLEEIVSSFLSLARESELSREMQPLDPLLSECVHLFTREAETRGLRLIAELRAGDTQLLLDGKQFKRAILNVLLNAIEACPPGGRVRVFSRCTDRNCEVEIRDDGPGLEPEVRERVFDPYFTTKPGGTGLGLAITRGIIEEHGGTIEMSSAAGQGCQVLISLPLGDKALR